MSAQWRHRRSRGRQVKVAAERGGLVLVEPSFEGTRLVQGPLPEDEALEALRRLGIAPVETAEVRSEQAEAAREHMPALERPALFLITEVRPSGEIADEWVRVVPGPRMPFSFDRRPVVEPMPWAVLVDIYRDVASRATGVAPRFVDWCATI